MTAITRLPVIAYSYMFPHGTRATEMARRTTPMASNAVAKIKKTRPARSLMLARERTSLFSLALRARFKASAKKAKV